jgi:hypothetical protein
MTYGPGRTDSLEKGVGVFIDLLAVAGITVAGASAFSFIAILILEHFLD